MNQKPILNINSLCANCYKKCKQKDGVLIIACPFYDPFPVQLELKFNKVRKQPKGKMSEK